MQLIFRPMTGEHHNKQFLTLGFPLALLRKHRSQSATQSYRPQDNYTDANIAVQRKVADYHANAVYFDLASAFSVSQDLRVSYHSERDSRFTSSLKQFQRNKKIRMRGFTRSLFLLGSLPRPMVRPGAEADAPLAIHRSPYLRGRSRARRLLRGKTGIDK